MRVVALLVVWALATAAGLAFAWQTHYGPVVFVVTHDHGVHLGDVAAFVTAYAWAGFLTVLLRPDHRPVDRREALPHG